MSTTERMTRCNVLFDTIPTSPDLGIIVRFPVRYMAELELMELSSLRPFDEFFIGYIDFSENTENLNQYVIKVGSLQEAVDVMIADAPFFDAYLN